SCVATLPKVPLLLGSSARGLITQGASTLMCYLLLALSVIASPPKEAKDVGPLVRALWLIHGHGTPDALNPANDQRVKGLIAKTVAKDGLLTLPELRGLMGPDAFNKLAGSDSMLDSAEVAGALEAATPESRKKLAPKLREHADYLTTTFDRIDEPHREAG